ncbi:3-keto-disaccharide hydrolase [Flagellimonas sp. 2504JD4-2]
MFRTTLLIALIAVFCFVSCKTDTKKEDQTWHTKKKAIENQVHNQLLDIEKEQGWTLLFDGETLNGWHLYNKPDSTQFSAWEVRDGNLFCNATDESKVFGDLVTDKAYKNYELVFEWQMALRGNGGVFINVQESPEFKATYNTGPEYQLLEPAHSDIKTPLKRPGCLWGLSPQLNKVEAKKVGQWNTAKIIQQNGKIQFYLNGKLTAQEDIKSNDWKNKIASSGFKDSPAFGKATHGKIALQNWYFEAWFRNMKIREL